LARGPARLCQALAIDRAQNGLDFCDPASPLRISGDASAVRSAADLAISAGPRVGVSTAADISWRFWVADEPTVSAYRPYKARSR
jgi:DNA-3-methyladenine glycosylase